VSVAARDSLPCTLELAQLKPAGELARGAAGTIEALARDGVAADRDLVLKRYHDGTSVRRDALERLTQWRRGVADTDRRRIDRITPWPLAVVSDGDALVGFVMHRIGAEFFTQAHLPSGARRPVLREAQYLVAPPDRLARLRIDEPSPSSRRELTWALAEAVAFLHRHRIVLGDVSTRNVLWAHAPPRVSFVDADSFSLGGVGSPVPPAFTIDWDDPAQPGLAAASSDVYKLALLVLRILARQFRTRDPDAAQPHLDPAGLALLRPSLSRDPAARPSAAAWGHWAASRRAARRASP
jgi:hypothetical protein